MNYRMISHVIGWILLFEAAFLLVPLITAIVYGERTVIAFLWTVLACVAVGTLLTLKRPKNQTLRARDGFVVVSLSWIAISLLGAMPFFLSGVLPSYIDALFETVSGFTTTGATVFSEVESLPNSILIWRSFTHWVGGMGVLVFIMAFVPLSGGRNMHIMKAESPGPDVSKLVPRVRTTALILYTIYLAMTVLQLILLLCGGMTFFEAFNTAVSTAGTGGFGFKNDGMLSYSPYIQVVVSVFMLLFSINFAAYFLAFRGRFKEALNTEVRTFLIIVAAAVGLVTLNIYHMYGSVGESVRHALFTVSSIISTTGFATVDFDLWPQLSKTILVLLMFVGACAGSTGGGVKVSRWVMLFKGGARELRAALHPKEVRKITVDGKPVEQSIVQSTFVYFACFVMLFIASVLLVSLDNQSFTTNFTAVAATINNVGPGLDAVGPTCNYGFFSPLSKLVLIFDMLAGRLELLPMLLLFAPATWKK